MGATGHEIQIRPVRRGDDALVQEIFDGMSAASRYHRFMQATPVLSPGMLRLLADVDGTRHRAWSAHIGDRAVGISRLIADSCGDLELSVAVIDSAHRRGVGRRLVDHALKEAAGDGSREVVIMVHPENGPSIALFRKLGARFRFEYGALIGRVPVPAGAEVAA